MDGGGETVGASVAVAAEAMAAVVVAVEVALAEGW